jgi:hypothetical protein
MEDNSENEVDGGDEGLDRSKQLYKESRELLFSASARVPPSCPPEQNSLVFDKCWTGQEMAFGRSPVLSGVEIMKKISSLIQHIFSMW